MRPRDERRFRRRCERLAEVLTSDRRYPDVVIVFNALLVVQCDAGGWWRLMWRVLRFAVGHEIDRVHLALLSLSHWWLVRRGVLVWRGATLHRRNCSHWACDSSCVDTALPWWARWAVDEPGVEEIEA